MVGFLPFILYLLVQISLADDFPGDSSTTAFLIPGGSRNGSIETTGDQDWFKTYLLAGRTYTITMYSIVDVKLSLLQASTVTQVAYNDDTIGYNPQIVYTPSTSEAFFVNCLPFSTGIGAYLVEISDTTSTCASTCSCKCFELLYITHQKHVHRMELLALYAQNL